jgi:hypothetical protein
MSISPYFQQLRSGYQAELDDLTSDSEGKDVLRKRLAEKRKEIGFLVQMMESSPEMVAVVLHQAFKFTKPAVLEHLLTLDSDELLSWDALQDAVQIAPASQGVVDTITAEPLGEWFMVVASALEYMHNRPARADERVHSDDEDLDGEEDRDEVREHRHDDNHTEDHDEEEQEARAREDAGNDWLVDQGFDRKD